MNVSHVELRDANAFIAELHRHHKPVQGHRFSIGANHGGKLVGVAVVGRPVARLTDQRTVVEVTRLATDGTKNACSFLYAAAARAAFELGYSRIQTFILASEPGTSLVASGWECLGTCGGGTWVRKNRDRRTDQPMELKTKYSKTLR